MKTQSGIYKITCLATNERYIGSSIDIRRRFKEHRYDLAHDCHDNGNLTALHSKYGPENFEFEIIELVEDGNKLYEREQYWFDTEHPELNIAIDARRPSFGLERSQETKDKLSASRKKFHSRLTPYQKERMIENIKEGRRAWWNSLSDEEKDKHIKSISNPHSEKTKAILSQKSKENNKQYWKGKHKPPESVEKARIGIQKKWDETKEERELNKEVKRNEFEEGREAREILRRKKLSMANSGKVLSQEQKDHLREVALAQQQDPEYREKHHAGVMAAMKDPEVLRRLSEAHKGYVMPEEQKEKIRLSVSKAQKERWARKKALVPST